jgi:hypothetical protein
MGASTLTAPTPTDAARGAKQSWPFRGGVTAKAQGKLLFAIPSL